MTRYRRIVKTKDSKYQGYQIALIALIFISISIVVLYLSRNAIESVNIDFLSNTINTILKILIFILLIDIAVLILSFLSREKVSTLEIDEMSKQANKTASKIKRLFNDKTIVDVLNFANKTRYGIEMPKIYVFMSDDLSSGYVAIENIATFDSLDKSKIEQQISGLLSGKYQRYSVVSSQLVSGDSYVLFNFEDTLTSMRFDLDSDDDIKKYISDDVHELKLAKDLSWHVNKVPHMSIIARTRAGKSVLAGRYLAKLMTLQNWEVEYNSAKLDVYVKKYNGQSEPEKIVERAEHWVSEMKKRLNKINELNVEKYTDVKDMNDIAIFFDEIGNLNAFLETDRNLKKRWETAINALTATGGSAGIHIISISQRATKEGFLTGLAKTNSSDAVIFLGSASDSATERQYLIPGHEMATRNYKTGQGIAKFDATDPKWENPHFYESPLFKDYV